MRVLVLGTYDLGRQPLQVAVAAAELRQRGHEVEALDLAVESLGDDRIAWAEAVAVSVPMHTGMSIGTRVAARVRRTAPSTPICLFGLYAAVDAASTVGAVVDRVVAGEFLPGLVAWIDEVSGLRAPTDGPVLVDVARTRTPVPDRRGLPALDRYARLAFGDGDRIAGAVEASRGCRHRCRHCPVPAVYGGRVRIVAPDAVLDDIRQLVAAGAEHVTFADPDFLNAPAHAERVVGAMRAEFPLLTYDVTVKVEHILRHADRWPVLAPGLLFVVSAFETTNDRILGILRKGHTRDDMAAAVHLLRDHGVDVRPSWLPFTPWTSVADVAEIFEFIAAHDLGGSVDPVQLSIRLLVPDGSLLLSAPEMAPHLGERDPSGLTWSWRAEHPETEPLQRTLAGIAAAGADSGQDPEPTLHAMWAAVADAAGTDLGQIPAGAAAGRPRMTEPWFC